MSRLDISEGVGHDGRMDKSVWLIALVILSVVSSLAGVVALRANDRLACQSRACKTEHTSPRLNRYGECVCVEMAQ